MSYPGRVAWAFRNVTQGFDFWPTLDSIQISDARPEELATFSCRVVDADASLTFQNEDVIRVTFDGDTVFEGDLIISGGAYLSAVGPRVWDLQAQDYTARLDDNVIEHGKRPSETLADRVAWIIGLTTRGITTGSVSAPAVTLDAGDCTGQTLREALDDVCQEGRCSYYVDWDRDLHLFRTETLSAPFGLDDAAPDHSAIYPWWDVVLTPDSIDFHDRVFVQADKPADNTWVTDDTWSAVHGVSHQERAVSDSNIKSAAKATKAGERDLEIGAAPTVTGSGTLAQPGLIGGMTIHIKPALFPEREGDYILTSVLTTAVDPHDDAGTGQLRVAIEFKDKRGHGTGSRGITDQLNRLTRRRFEQGNPEACTEVATSDTATWVELHPAGASLVFATGAGWGAENLSWPFTPCGVGPGAWLDAFAAGGYYAFTAPAAAGQLYARLPSFGPASVHGAADGWDVYLFAGSAPTYGDPSLGAYGTLIARSLTGVQDVVIPAGLIPWGSDFCIIVWPGWLVDRDGYACGLGGGARPEASGQLGCGEYAGFPSTLSFDYLRLCDDGQGYLQAAPFEAPDGALTEFTLTSWDGVDLPSVFRNGVLVALAGKDPGAGTVTLNEAPRTGDLLTARYHVGGLP